MRCGTCSRSESLSREHPGASVLISSVRRDKVQSVFSKIADKTAEMVHYKLTYFNLRGRAELSRLILHHAQVPFEDFRFERAEWPQHKASTAS